MQIAKITEAVTKSPFQPFEVITSSGDRFTIRHPEMVRVAKGALYVYQDADQPHEGEMWSDPAVLPYMHITALVPVPEQAA